MQGASNPSSLPYLPPYSPDLNTIEFGWKELKRGLGSNTEFEAMVEKSREIALKLFKERKTDTRHTGSNPSFRLEVNRA
jgi:transposase